MSFHCINVYNCCTASSEDEYPELYTTLTLVLRESDHYDAMYRVPHGITESLSLEARFGYFFVFLKYAPWESVSLIERGLGVEGGCERWLFDSLRVVG